MKTPLVSIISPCYNAEKYVSKLLESVLSQNYESIEFIVIDDGSTDGTLSILNGYKRRFKKKNIAYQVLTKGNGGAASAVNRGLSIFTGDYLTFIDADDFLNKNSITKRVEFLEKNDRYDVVYSATDVVNERDYGKVIKIKKETISPPRENLFDSMISEEDYIWTHSYFIRTSYFLKVNPARHIQEFKAGQNIQIFLPIWYRAVVGYIDEPLVTIVEHHDSHSRIARSQSDIQQRNRQIENIYLDTLNRIDMPDYEKEKYKTQVKEKYQKKRRRVFQIVTSNKDELGRLYDYDEQKFRHNYASDINKANQRQLASKMIFSSHSLEKSLSNDNFEVGHGFRVSRLLVEMLEMYKKKEYDQKDLAYVSTLSVLKAFYERHKGTNFSEEIEGIFGEMQEEILSCRSTIGGSDEIPITDKQNNHKKNFKELAENRFAIRMYSDKAVDRRDVKDAVQIAMKTPTVCNRQSLHVYEIYEKEVIEAVLKIQGGIAFYDTPPVLLLITADDNGYVGANERNQGFVDGGLFAMSLLYALEYKKLAACPCHAMLNEIKDKTIRGMLDLPDSEKLITFISVGHFKERNNVCKSFRYSADHVLSEKNKIHDFVIETVSASKPQTVEKKSDGVMLTIRKKVRIRTRLRELKHKTRVRTRIREAIRRREISKDEKLRRSVAESPQGAILTLTDYHNYGNILQRYALQKFLLRNGYRFISYGQESFNTKDKSFDRFRNTIKFVEQRIPRKVPDKEDKFPVYIAGSDQIWRKWGGTAETLLEKVKYYFFDFLDGSNAKRVVYAASFGQDDIKSAGLNPEFMSAVRPLVEQIDAVSVREKSAVGIVKKWWDVDAELVVDPTILLSQKDYNKLIDYSTCKLEPSPPIFAYLLNQDKRRVEDLNIVQKAYGLTSDVLYLKQKELNLPPVEQWLKNIRDAELVVTDSFHGLAFSLVNNTPFIVLVNELGGLSRIESLLSELGLEDRLLRDTDINEDNLRSMKPIDWVRVNKKVKEMRKDSSKWLLRSIRA